MEKSTLTVLLLLLSCTSLAHAERGDDSLKGLTAVVFNVHSYGSKLQPVLWGVESDLRQAGLKLVSVDDSNGPVAHLDLDLTLACTGHACGYTVRLQLTQHMRLARKPDIESDAVTWADGYQNAIGKADLATLNDLYIANSRALIKSFLDDYRTANPKK